MLLLLSSALAGPCAVVEGGSYTTSKAPTFEGTEPTADAKLAATELACALEQDPSRVLHIGAHTDARGSSVYNLKVSQARADALKELVLAAGAKQEQVSARGYGEDYPVADNVSAEGRATNHRIELLTADPKRPLPATAPVPAPVPVARPAPPPAPDPCKPLPTPDTPCTGVHLCPVDQHSYLECSAGEWTRITEFPADPEL